MKKLLFVFAFCCAGIVANAQLYLGGSVNINVAGTKFNSDDNDDTKNKNSSFSLGPRIGYILDEKWEIGGSLSIYTSKLTTEENGPENINKNTGWILSPFAQYNVLTVNKFALKFHGSAYLGTSKTKHETDGHEDSSLSAFMCGFGIDPMLTYSLNEHFRLETTLNFLGIGLNSTTSKYDDTDDKQTNTNFILNANSHEIVNVGDITIGFFYIF